MKKLIVNFAPTGMIPTKEMTPYVPIYVDEIVEDVHRAFEVGITMVHLHARDERTGEPTYKASIYGEIIEGIRAFSKDLIICVSTSGRTFKRFAERSECLTLTGDSKPDMGSLTLSSLNFNKVASVNRPDMIQQLAKEMLKRGIKPELEAFDLGMINYAKYLASKELIKPPFYFNLILGNVACAQANPLSFGLMINELPANSIWSVGGIGNYQLTMNASSIVYGGGVRVGLEDNIWFDEKRTKYATNLRLLKRIHNITESLEREIMNTTNATTKTKRFAIERSIHPLKKSS